MKKENGENRVFLRLLNLLLSVTFIVYNEWSENLDLLC